MPKQKASKSSQAVAKGQRKQEPKPKKPRAKSNALGGIGGALGSMLGPVGMRVGEAAGNFLSSITGLGAYKVRMNSLMNEGVPTFRNTMSGFRTGPRREFVSDITCSSAFSAFINQARINPANPILFPWMAQISPNFEQYRVHGMIFEFLTTSANAVSSTNGSLGTVVIATQYDVHDPPFLTKQQMESYEFAVSTIPSQSVIHPIECAPSKQDLDLRYVAQSIPNGSDQAFFDIGLLTVATQGQQAAFTAGELWVSYDVEFLKPKISGQIVNDYASGTAYLGSANDSQMTVWSTLHNSASTSTTNYLYVGASLQPNTTANAGSFSNGTNYSTGIVANITTFPVVGTSPATTQLLNLTIGAMYILEIQTDLNVLTAASSGFTNSTVNVVSTFSVTSGANIVSFLPPGSSYPAHVGGNNVVPENIYSGYAVPASTNITGQLISVCTFVATSTTVVLALPSIYYSFGSTSGTWQGTFLTESYILRGVPNFSAYPAMGLPTFSVTGDAATRDRISRLESLVNKLALDAPVLV